MKPRHPVDDYRRLIGVIEDDARQFGATPKGVGWPTEIGLVNRFDVMLDITTGEQGHCKLLDLGCGPGLALDYLSVKGWLEKFDYSGVDVSPMMVDMARADWPDKHFEVRDVIVDPFPVNTFDYTIVNGVCTSRVDLSQNEMEDFVMHLMEAAWQSTRKALAFNVMSTHVDWTRDDLFHWPMDSAMAFCKRALSRHVRIRADYGAWEYTVQVFREPCAASTEVPSRWLDARQRDQP